MKQNEGCSALEMIGAFVMGSLAGAALTLLLTPVTGEEVRFKLRRAAEAGRLKASKIPGALKSAYTGATEAAKDAFEG